jgi:eukaryotic-like serine/threonine-protein kinase
VAGILAGVLWVQSDGAGQWMVQSDPSPTTTGPTPADTRPPAGSSPSPGSATTTNTPAPGASGSRATAHSATTRPSEPPASPSRSPQTTTAPRTTAPPQATTRAPGSPPSADDLAGAVRAYYGSLPDGTDEAWSRLTPRYQTRGEATSRDYFERFWGQYSRVTLSDVSGQPPNRAVATITYYYKNGTVEKDRAAFWLAIEDGQLKIDDRKVLRSWEVPGG